MMKKIIFFAIIAAVFIFISGCTGPSYQPCCKFANATDPDNPICDAGIDPDTGDLMVWELSEECDQDAWACKVLMEGQDGSVSLPICPRLKEVKCNTTCSGVFCGSFFFDPRPSFSAVYSGSVYPDLPGEVDEDDEGDKMPPKPMGLWNAQCAVQNITPLFLRHIENSDSITMNTFRFGVGNSFQDFEDAQYYFPLSDKACSYNPAGWIDRYIVYAIPNRDSDGDKLCGYLATEETGCNAYRYVCYEDPTIFSMSYFECAHRCALSHYGLGNEFDPYNPYPTENQRGEFIGNPFAYGLEEEYKTPGMQMDHRVIPPLGGTVLTHRATVGELSERQRDDYQKGATLYGATFGWSGMSFDIANGELPLLPFIAQLNKGADSPLAITKKTGLFSVPYTDSLFTNNDDERFYPMYLDWQTDSTRAKTAFITLEHDPHNIYPWLLKHHSVYGEQINLGRSMLPNGSTRHGAEFECKSGAECISGYCSTEDYSRSACVKYFVGQDYTMTQEVDCDCYPTAQGVVCVGTRETEVAPWDNPDAHPPLKVGVPMAAPIVPYTRNTYDDVTTGAEAITFLPSLAAVVELPIVGGPGGGNAPVFIIPVGAPYDEIGNYEPRFEKAAQDPFLDDNPLIAMPTYTSVTHDEIVDFSEKNSRCAFLTQIINPTSAGMIKEAPTYNVANTECFSTLWVSGPACFLSTGTVGIGGMYGSATVEGVHMNPHSPEANPIIEGYHWNMLDGEQFIETIGETTFLGGCGAYTPLTALFQSGMYSHHFCDPGTDWQNYCSAVELAPQKDRFYPKILEQCDVEPYTMHLCFSKSASDKYSLPSGFSYYRTTWQYFEDRPNLGLVPLLEPQDEVCERIRQLGDGGGEDPTFAAAYKRAVCYQWASGGRKPTSDADVCVAEALAFIVVTPQIVQDGEYAGRYSFGNCLLNSRGNDLEVTNYGVCESCGFLTMAKEHVFALPDDSSDPGYDLAEFEHGGMYGNNYCPDLLVQTPFSISALHHAGVSHAGEEWKFYMLAPGEQAGAVSVKYGSNVYGGGSRMDQCRYPNGRAVFDDYDKFNVMSSQRGLPHTIPNAYYINRKLESLMKRNIQPVLFADDKNLWKISIMGGSDQDTDENNLLVLKLKPNDDPEWSTSELLKDLYIQRPDLFIQYRDRIQENSYITVGGSFLANAVLNEGGLILVMKIAENEQEGDDFEPSDGALCLGPDDGECERKIHSRIDERALPTRLLCPNCMSSVAVGYVGTHEPKFNNSARFEQMARVFGYRDLNGQIITNASVTHSCREGTHALCNEKMLSDIDIVSTKLVLQDGDSYCSLSGKARHEAVMQGILEIGTTTLKRYSKPVLITDFIIKRGSCWDEKEAGEMMSYLGMNVNLLAKSGVLGIIYGDWESTESERTGVRFEEKDDVYGYRGEFYEGVFSAARNFAGFSLRTFYNELPITEKCLCQPCTPSDDPALCNGHFKGILSAPVCDGYVPKSSMKWPDGCMTQEVCMDEDNLRKSTIMCTIQHANGTKQIQHFDGNDIAANPSVYKDVIASISRPGVPGGDYLLVNPIIFEQSSPAQIVIESFGIVMGDESQGWQGGTVDQQQQVGQNLGLAIGAESIGIVAHGGDTTLGNIGLIPCFTAESINLSFTTILNMQFGATPAAFSMEGDPSVACDPAEGVSEICGYVPPIVDYVMDCTIINPDYPVAVMPACIANSLGPCQSHADCPIGEICNSYTGFCEAPIVE